jgi:hypothetical protein
MKEQGGVPSPTGEGVSRRQLLRRIAVGGGVVWATPVVTSMLTPAAAGTPAPTTTTTQAPQECGCLLVGPGQSGTVFPCGEVSGCHCFTLDTGEQICIPGRVACGQPCPCGPDEVCVVDSCCPNGRATCIPRERLENGQRVCAGDEDEQEEGIRAVSLLADPGVPTLTGAVA